MERHRPKGGSRGRRLLHNRLRRELPGYSSVEERNLVDEDVARMVHDGLLPVGRNSSSSMSMSSPSRQTSSGPRSYLRMIPTARKPTRS